MGRKGEGKGRGSLRYVLGDRPEISPPQSFLKVGAYDGIYCLVMLMSVNCKA